MGRIGRVVKALFDRRAASPAQNVVVQLEAAAGENRTAEMYHPPGISSAPSKQDRVVVVPVGRGSHRIAIGSHNYRIEVSVDEGEISVYSTNAAGDTVAARIDLDNDGNIDLNGNSKRLVTYGELNTALQSFKTSIDTAIASAITGHTHAGVTVGSGTSGPGAGAASPTSLDISAAETATVRTGG
ncbi:MAG: hypothetical protein ACOC2N_01280 [Spirochaetota bacterium]